MEIDHTLLKATATEAEIKKLCEEAIQYQFTTVCIPPYYVPFAKTLLEGTSIGITTVIGFPLGNTTSQTKAFEAKEAVENGATDIDMVMNIGALKDKDYETVKKDIKAVVQASKGAITKVIIETCYLTNEEIEKATELVIEAGADFVKTSTGFGPDGATVETVQLMKRVAGDQIKIKASGGIRDAKTAQYMIHAGASRLGTSQSVNIVSGKESTAQGDY